MIDIVNKNIKECFIHDCLYKIWGLYRYGYGKEKGNGNGYGKESGFENIKGGGYGDGTGYKNVMSGSIDEEEYGNTYGNGRSRIR
jgi:hypothetical protein